MTDKRQDKSLSHIQRKLIPSYIFLIIVSIISVFPLYWMATAATNTTVEVARGKIWFGTNLMENYKNLIAQQNLWQSMWNSFFYAIVQTVLCLLICSLAGYGFELYHDKHKDRLFGVLLLAMMVPQVATLIPLFTMISKLKLLNTVWAFIIPSISTPFMIMMFRQSSRNFPMALLEAARIDGGGHYRHERMEQLHVAPHGHEGQRRSDHAHADRQPFQRLCRGLRYADAGRAVLFTAHDHHILRAAEAVCRGHHRRGEVM